MIEKVGIYFMYVSMHLYMYVCTYVVMYVCTYVVMYLHMYDVCTNMCVRSLVVCFYDGCVCSCKSTNQCDERALKLNEQNR